MIYGTSKVIEMISDDQGIEIFIPRWVVVLDDELLSITIIGEYFFITKSGVYLVSPLK